MSGGYLESWQERAMGLSYLKQEAVRGKRAPQSSSMIALCMYAAAGLNKHLITPSIRASSTTCALKRECDILKDESFNVCDSVLAADLAKQLCIYMCMALKVHGKWLSNN